MAARTTRRSLAELKKSIINDDKDIVIIPAELLIKLLSTHATTQETFTKTAETFMEKFSLQIEKTAAVLDRVAIALESRQNERHDDFHQSLLEKLSELSSTIASNATTSGVSLEEKLKHYTDKRKEILSKTIRAEKLSEYYTELINADTPYVPHKFRTKISHTTPEFEKPFHKEDSINKVSYQIKLMNERVKNWKEELQRLETDTNLSIQGMNDNDRDTFLANIAKCDDAVVKDRTQSVDKLRETYEKEMNKSGVNPDLFLLNYADKPYSSSKNVRGHHTRWRGRGRGWPQR